MQVPKRIKELNNKFGLRFGFKYGRPRYAWLLSDDVKYPVENGQEQRKTASGLWVVGTKYEFVKQVDGPSRWVLAILVDPPSEAEWSAMFGSLPYPGRGQYVATDQMCKIGVEPTEELTGAMIGLITEGLEATREQKRDAIEERAERDDREIANRRNDFIDDSMPAFGNLPGTKESVSFPGVTLV